MIPPEQHDALQAARDATLVETNAQAIFENLRHLRNYLTIHRRRWIWELLQNAVDATDPSKGKNQVRIDYDGTKLRFSHNGAAFNGPEISHLIYHGSSKQGDESKKGKFGTGFLTVHLVSHKIRILGTVDDESKLREFEFFLDRSGETPKAIQEKMEVAWSDFKNSLQLKESASREFTTVFECDVDGDAGAVVNVGLADLTIAVPFVLAFLEELEEVSLGGIPGKRSWRKIERRPLGKWTAHAIECTQPDGTVETIRVAVVGDHHAGTAIAVMLRQTAGNWEPIVNEGIPRLFYPLPLVDTHDLPFPFVISATTFEPTEARNGVYASAAGENAIATETNWKLLNSVPSLFTQLMETCSAEKWENAHEFARYKDVPTKEWLDPEKLKSDVLSKLISYLRSNEAPGVVLTEGGALIRLSDAKIPINDLTGDIYRLGLEVTELQNKLPVLKLAADWAKILEGWKQALKIISTEQLEEALTAEKLGKRVTTQKSLAALGETLVAGSGASALIWLNKLLNCVPSELLPGFLKEHCLLPNQRGELKREADLRPDADIATELKDICETLGESIRTELLHELVYAPIKELLGSIKGRSVTNEDCLQRALTRVKELPKSGQENSHQAGNAALLRWLIRNDRADKLSGYPLLCLSGSQELRVDKRNLAPVSLWDSGSKPFASLFPKEVVALEHYTTVLEENDWRFLNIKGFVSRSLFYSRSFEDLDQQLLVEPLPDEGEHKIGNPVFVNDLMFYGKILDDARRSNPKAKLLLGLMLNYVIKADRTWIDGKSVSCSCKVTHRVLPAWMDTLKNNEWVPLPRKKHAKPSAENLSKLLDEDLINTILGDKDCSDFLLKLGIGVGDLLRFKAPEHARSQIDRLSARIYASADPSTMESIATVLDDADIREAVLKKKHDKITVQRNQFVGQSVEKMLKQELEAEGIAVTRTAIGSDFGLDIEPESDFIENNQEQLLKVNQFLLEIKSTSAPFVRMTLRQGEEAIKEENRKTYTLCVVNVSDGLFSNPEAIRRNSRFVVSIGPIVEDKVLAGQELKVLENGLNPQSGKSVEIDIVESSVKLKINSDVWLTRGISFEEFVKAMKLRQAELNAVEDLIRPRGMESQGVLTETQTHSATPGMDESVNDSSASMNVATSSGDHPL